MTKTATREKPILFSGPMVRSILDGKKTQTRRVVKCCCNTTHLDRLLGDWTLSKPPHKWDGQPMWRVHGRKPIDGDWVEEFQTDVDDNASAVVSCPYGQPGDRLWVREAFARPLHGDSRRDTPMRSWPAVYRADVGIDQHFDCQNYRMHDSDFRWRPSIHMPRWASRITLEITNVRVERLQEISKADARAEGVEPGCLTCGENCVDRGGCGYCRPAYRDSFAYLWTKLNGRESWDVNPWVWVVEFRRLGQ
jgi:hypothetical protein